MRPLAVGPAGAVLGAVPIAEIRAYCELFGVADVEEFVHLIRAMDDAALAHAAKRRRAADGVSPPETGGDNLEETAPWTSR